MNGKIKLVRKTIKNYKNFLSPKNCIFKQARERHRPENANFYALE